MAENTPQALARRFRGAFLCTIIRDPPTAPCAFARISSDFYPFMLLRHFNLFDLKIYMNSIALSAHKSKKKHKFVIYSICQGDFVRSVIHNYRYKKEKGCGAFLFFTLLRKQGENQPCFSPVRTAWMCVISSSILQE